MPDRDGDRKMRKAMRLILFLGIFLGIVLARPVLAQDVTLTSRDGSVQIHGTLVGFDGEFYRVQSEFGLLMLDGSGVDCTGPGCPNLDDFVAELNISGDAALGATLFPDLLAAFAEDHGYRLDQTGLSEQHTALELSDDGRIVARIDIRLNTASEGFADLIAEETDLVLSFREVFSDEALRMIDAGLGDPRLPGQNRVVALDALVVGVSPRNPVGSISVDDLIAIYNGETQNWADLGGLDAPIVPHAHSVGTGASDLFLERFLLPVDKTYSPEVEAHPDNLGIVQALESDPFAIGLVPLSARGSYKTLTLVGGCGFRTAAEPNFLKSEDYPLTAPVFLYMAQKRLPTVAREFIRFLQTTDAQITVLQSGYVDQTISRMPLSRQGDRLANAILASGEETLLDDLQDMVVFLHDMRRLSVTFRFVDGSAELDAQSRSNILLVARAIERGTFGSGELTLVGFSDGDGPAGANKALSLKRAEAVRSAIIAEAATIDPLRFRIAVKGFGEALPMACDASGWGRKANRRVEVWTE